MEKEIEELKKQSEAYAKSAGIKLNPDKQIVNSIIKGLLKNKETKGDIYCPCRIPTGDKEIVCPCIFHMNEIKEEGHCKCRLFVK